MATAVSGCIITKEEGTQMTYQKKCDSCGYVLPGTTTTASTLGTYNSSFRCPKCGKNQKIVINK